MKQTQQTPIVVTLWQHCRNLLGTQPAPSIWFDPRPNRRVRRNVWRGMDTYHRPTPTHLSRNER